MAFRVEAWPTIGQAVRDELRDLLLERQVAESGLAEASHVFLLLPADGDPADSPLPLTDERIIPVVVGDEPSKLMPDHSQLVVTEAELGRAGARLTGLARLSGTHLVAVNRLRSSALRWAASGGDASQLLPASELASATETLLTAVGAGMAGDTTRTFVEASRKAVTGRIRRQAGGLGIAVVALLVATALAVQFSLSSQKAAATARERQAVAQSIRLAGEVEAQLVNGSDPDLGWLLAEVALRSAATAEAEIAARMVASMVPQHRSLRLAQSPELVAISADGARVAVAYEDGSAEVFDDEMLSVRSVAPAADETPGALALSANGRCVALASASKVVADCDGERGFWEFEADVVSAAWLGERLAVVTVEALYVGVLGADPRRVSVQLDEVDGAAFTVDGEAVALASAAKSVLIQTATGQVVREGVGGNRVAAAPSGQEYLVRDSRGITNLVKAQEGDRASEQAAVLQVFPGAPFVVAPGGPKLCAVGDLAAGFDGCFVAHQGLILGGAGLPDGTLASIGSDRYLRLWEGVRPHSHVSAELVMSNELGRLHSSQGNQVAWNGQSEWIFALQYSTGVMARFDGLAFVDGQFHGLQLANPIAMSFDGSAMARWPSKTLVCRAPSSMVAVDTETAMTRARFMAPASDCSVTVACDEEGCLSIDDTGETRLSVLDPIGVGTDSQGRPVVHQGDGRAVGADGAAVQGAGEGSISATSLGERTAWVNGSNRLRTAVQWGERRDLLDLPSGWNVLRTELLADGELVAVYTRDRVLVAGTGAPRDVRYVGPGPELGQDDLTVTGDGILVGVSAEFGLHEEPLEGLATFRERLSSGLPRQLLPEEVSEFEVTP